jgi:uncharacterized cupin superfamily protein
VTEARLVDTGAGLVPQGEGWFVLNLRDGVWFRNEVFGSRVSLEAGGRVAKEFPQLEEQPFPELGFTVFVLPPGKPSTMYHAETGAEGFLILQGECLLIVEGTERRLRAWDFFHCPQAGHAFVGLGDEPCVIVMVGARPPTGSIRYIRDEKALEHGAGVEQETPDPNEAYAPFPHWQLGRPEGWDELPWSR